MKKPLFLFLIFLSVFLLRSENANAQVAEKYSRVKVYASNTQMNDLHAKGVALDEMAERNDSYFIGDFSSKEIALIKEAKLRIEIIIDDLTRDFIKRNKESSIVANEVMRTGGTPPGFSYGSMGGYLTYSQMVSELDELKTMYPNLITAKTSLGTTAEGRQIWMVKISDNPDVDESSEAGVFYGSLYHAREPISMMNLTYFMQFILSKYGTDPEITCLINNRELYFVPCANPDGYVYNQTTNPAGGGYWRKNRRNNGNGTYGVDLNRNFSYNWGFDNNGSSPTPSAEDYRGPSAASEPEIVAIQNFISSNQLTIALNNHTYGNKVVIPFEYNGSATGNELHFNNVASLLTADNGFQYGKQLALLGYNANGTADDWMHGTGGLYSYTIETSPDSDGFWPVQSKIIPTCEKNLEMNIEAAWGAGNYIRPRVPSNLYVSGLSYELPISITNYGNTTGTSETVSISISDPRVITYDASSTVLTGIVPDETWSITRNITFSSSATNGTINANLIVTNLEGCTYTIPFSFQYSPNGCFGIPSSWTSLDIGLPGVQGSSCYQNGTYTISGAGMTLMTNSDKCHMMKLVTATNVTEIRAQILSAQNTGNGARAGITIAETSNPGSKRVSLLFNPVNNRIEFQARNSTNGSINSIMVNSQTAPKWLRLVKSSGGNWQAYYSSNGTSWTYINKQKVSMVTNVTAGLMVNSGSSTVLQTATFNNLSVTTAGGIITRRNDLSNIEFESTEVNKEEKFTLYPNPSKGLVEVRLPASSADQMISVFDINGKEVHKEMLGSSNYKKIDLSNLSNGLYFIRYKEGTKVQYEKFIINK